MALTIRPATLFASMALATALLPTGCTTLLNDQTTKLPATLQRAQQDYEQAITRIKVTENDLNELSLAANVDVKQAYASFSKSADRMRESGNMLVSHADAMHYRGGYYFVESGKSAAACLYPRSAVPEEKDATEVNSHLTDLAEEGWEVKRVWRAFQFDIDQIQEHLSRYPSAKGVEAIPFLFRKARVDSHLLQESLAQTLAALERARTAKTQAELEGNSGIIPQP